MASDNTTTTQGTPKARIVAATMALAGERRWEDFSISDVALRAGVSLADFRDCFPSKGAVLGAFARDIDRAVLDGQNDQLMDESAKERLFDVLMRRLDAMKPFKDAIDGITDWTRRDPAAAAALNRVNVNSMRFMLESAGIDSEGGVGALKVQGLALAFSRIVAVWLRDEDEGLSETMAALDRELTRGGTLVARAEDINRLVSPLRAVARSLWDAGPGRRTRTKSRDDDNEPSRKDHLPDDPYAFRA